MSLTATDLLQEEEENALLSPLTEKQEQVLRLIHNATPGSRTLIGYGGAAGGGKLLDVLTPIPTPSGWKLNGDLQDGDEIFGEHGQVIKVQVAHPSRVLPSLRVVFDDGSFVDTHEDHLWLTYNASELAALTRRDPEWRAARRAKRPSRATGKRSAAFSESITKRNQATPPPVHPTPTGTIRTTMEIMNTLRLPDGRSNHAIPIAGAIELSAAALPVDPYVLGAWLGDGTAVSGRFTGIDPEIWDEIEQAGYTVTHSPSPKSHGILGLQVQLRALGVLGNKHIPPQYLRASKEQRLALLQGLMDTDGTCNKAGSCEFDNTNKAIIDGAYELIASLGWKAKVVEGRAKLNGIDHGPRWRIKWTPSGYVFRLPRKRERQVLATRRTTRFRYIKSIEPVGEKEMRCITVDTPSGLYLAGKDFIVTHNSYLLARMAFVLSIAYPGNRGLVGRQTLVDLKETTMREFYNICPEELIMKKSESEFWVKIQMPDWPKDVYSQVFFKGMENWKGKLSDAYGFVIIDEASEVETEAAQYFLTRLRWRLPKKVEGLLEKQCRDCRRIIMEGDCPSCGDTVGNGLRYYMLCASNPFPGFFTEWFYKRRLDKALADAGGVNSVHFVQALPSDNPHNDAGYVDFMRSTLSPDMVARMVDGRFDVFVGRVYEAFDPEVHRWEHNVIPEYKKVVGGLDFGGESENSHYSGGMIRIVTGDGRSIRVDEFKARGPDIAEQQQKWMVAMEKKWATPIKKKIEWRADRSQMVAVQLWRKMGFNVKATKGGPGSVDEGIKEVAKNLNKDVLGIPRSFYLPHLKMWEEEMMEYRRDPETHRIVKENDDLVDADRYAEEAIGVVVGDLNILYKNALSRVK